MQAQRVTYIIESDAVSQLCIQQGDDMAPGTERADFLLHPRFTSQLRNQELRNEVAYLPQQIESRRRWNVICFLFHPCRVAGPNKPFQLFLKFLWDGCGIEPCDKREPGSGDS